MTTIKDIASYTGVTPTTVSNVINGRSGRVSAETVLRIQEAIKTLNYVPNMSARSLVSNSSKVIALINHVIVRENSNFMDDPFQASLIGVIEAVLRENGYYLMVRTVDTAEELITFLHRWNVDGLFITGIFRDQFFETLSTLTLPIVFIDSYVHHPNFCNVGLEDFKGSYNATSYLIEKGHRRIAFTSPSIRDGGVLQERFLGYRAALTENGISFDQSLIFEHEMDYDSCIDLSKSLAQIRELTAIVASADIMAAGLMSGLRENHIRIPEDLSIIGFDDLYICQMITPRLTTIHQDMSAKGKAAVDFMIKRLSGEALDQTEIILQTSLVERESVRDLTV